MYILNALYIPLLIFHIFLIRMREWLIYKFCIKYCCHPGPANAKWKLFLQIVFILNYKLTELIIRFIPEAAAYLSAQLNQQWKIEKCNCLLTIFIFLPLSKKIYSYISGYLQKAINKVTTYRCLRSHSAVARKYIHPLL